MKLKRTAVNGLVMLGSLLFGLVLCEIASRFVLDPGNYLSVTTVPDQVLGMTIAPRSVGFDDWGFRNRVVPAAADIVTVGDSHTFGNTARMEDAWPSVVGKATGARVYNLGLGGYGPNQYYQLLTTRALSLHPSWVFCGVYMGDDFENAFSITYGLEHWSSLRAGDWKNVDSNIWDVEQRRPWHKEIRNWLSRHSIIYQLVVHGPFLANAKEEVEFKRASRGDDPVTTTLELEDKGIREAFRPASMATRLDQTAPQVVEGMRITFKLLKAMDTSCRENKCQFAVVIIPTKETVFADYLEGKSQIHLHEAIDKTIANERIARQKLIEWLSAEGVAYIDTLPALKSAVGNQLYARTANDMHPGRNGYQVIGDEVVAYLNRSHVDR